MVIVLGIVEDADPELMSVLEPVVPVVPEAPIEVPLPVVEPMPEVPPAVESVVAPGVAEVLGSVAASVDGVVVAVDGVVVDVLDPLVEASSAFLPQAVRTRADIRARAAIETDFFIRRLLAFVSVNL